MDFEALVKHISTIQSTLQAQAAHAVNLALTARNWLMGCYIVEFEQNGGRPCRIRRTTVEEAGTAAKCQRTERAQVS